MVSARLEAARRAAAAELRRRLRLASSAGVLTLLLLCHECDNHVRNSRPSGRRYRLPPFGFTGTCQYAARIPRGPPWTNVAVVGATDVHGGPGWAASRKSPGFRTTTHSCTDPRSRNGETLLQEPGISEHAHSITPGRGCQVVRLLDPRVIGWTWPDRAIPCRTTACLTEPGRTLPSLPGSDRSEPCYARPNSTQPRLTYPSPTRPSRA